MKKILTSKVGKRGKLLIYANGKKATEKERKEFLNKNYQLIDKDTVKPEEWKYVNRVKGGKERAKNSLTYKGVFLSKKEEQKALKELVERSKKMGIDIEAIQKGLDVESVAQLFKMKPELKESFDKIMSETGLPFWYSIWTYDKELKETKRTVFVNNTEMSKDEALKAIDDIISVLVLKYQPAGGAIKFSKIGAKEVYILDSLTLAIAEQMNASDPRELDGFINEIELYISKPVNEKGKKSKKSNKRK